MCFLHRFPFAIQPLHYIQVSKLERETIIELICKVLTPRATFKIFFLEGQLMLEVKLLEDPLRLMTRLSRLCGVLVPNFRALGLPELQTVTTNIASGLYYSWPTLLAGHPKGRADKGVKYIRNGTHTE